MNLPFNGLILAGLCLAILPGCSGRVAHDAADYASAAELESFCDRLPRPAYAAFEKHAASDGWFEVYEVAAGIWAIYEPFQWQEVVSYLIVGTESAVLFDTGNGIGDIKAVVDRLTDRPVRVLNSHSHFDHIGGNHQFDEVLSVSTPFTLNNAAGIRNDAISNEVSRAALCRELPAGITQEDHRIRPFTISQTITDGHVLDIGGRKLEVLRVPGHTDDAIALLDREAGFLWSGDSFYEGPIWLFFPETDLAAYQKSVARLAGLAPDLKAVFPAHNTPRADPALLVELRDSIDRVLAGKIEPVPVADGNVEFRFQGFSLLMRDDYRRIPDPLAAGWQGASVCEKLREDSWQRILRCSFPPGVGHEHHFHDRHFGYAIAGGRMRITDSGGTRTADLATGSSYASDGVAWHEVFNVGDTTVVYLIVEPK